MRYWVKVRFYTTGVEAVLTFDSSLMRAMQVIALSGRADILDQGEVVHELAQTRSQ